MTQTRSPRLSVRAGRSASVLAVLSLLLLAGPAAATGVDYSEYLHWTSVVPGAGGGDFLDVTLSGDRLYAARADGGVQILSLADPARPVPLGSVVPPGEALEVAVAGDFAFVAAGAAGLQVLDCSDPASPQVVAAAALPGPAQGVLLDGATAYVSCAEAGLVAVDVSDPAAPVPGAVADTPGTAVRAALLPGHVAVADGAGGVQFVSRTTHAIDGAVATVGLALSLVTVGSDVFVADYYAGLTVVDASSVGDAEVVGSMFSAPGVFDVAVRDGLAVLANANAGLVTADVSDPTDPVRISVLSASGFGNGVVLGDGHAYLADTGDLHTYALGNGDTVPILGVTPFESPRFAACDRRWTYVVDGDRLWVTEPGTGAVVGLGATFFDPRDLAVAELRVYVADAGAGVRAVDVSDAAHPRVGAGLYVGGEANGLALDGDRLLVAVGGLGLAVLDLADDPHAPELVGLCALEGEALDVALAGDTAFVAAGDGGLWSVDVSDPAAPVVLDRLDEGHDLHRVVVAGDRVVAIDETALRVVDASDPADLVPVAECTLRGPLRDLATMGDVVYVVDPYIGLYVVDLSAPGAPAVVGGGISASFFISSVTRCFDRLYVVDREGVFRMPVHGPTTGVDGPPRPGPALAAAPNPFNPRTTLRFELDAPGRARLDVYDLLGRRVATLADRPFPAGAHALSWDGRDDGGRALPAGVYLARLRAAAGERSRKITLVR